MISPSQVRGRPVNRTRWARLLAGSLAETPEQGPPPAEATPSAVGPPPYIFGYIRVSDFERQENSEAVQEDLIDKRAAIADIPGTYVGCLVDYLSSKQFPFDQRPHGQWLLRNVRPGDSIIVTKMDRFGRTLGDMTETIERLYDRGAAIYILNHGGTPLAVDSTVGRAMIGFLAVSARLENDLRADRIRETIAYRKAKGLYVVRGREGGHFRGRWGPAQRLRDGTRDATRQDGCGAGIRWEAGSQGGTRLAAWQRSRAAV
jgi:DNA invertase Pin-like site-specific DNA recombinase